MGGRLLAFLNSSAANFACRFQCENQRRSPNSNAGECRVPHQMDGRFLGLLDDWTTRARRSEEPLVGRKHFRSALREVRFDVHRKDILRGPCVRVAQR